MFKCFLNFFCFWTFMFIDRNTLANNSQCNNSSLKIWEYKLIPHIYFTKYLTNLHMYLYTTCYRYITSVKRHERKIFSERKWFLREICLPVPLTLYKFTIFSKRYFLLQIFIFYSLKLNFGASLYLLANMYCFIIIRIKILRTLYKFLIVFFPNRFDCYSK